MNLKANHHSSGDVQQRESYSMNLKLDKGKHMSESLSTFCLKTKEGKFSVKRGSDVVVRTVNCRRTIDATLFEQSPQFGVFFTESSREQVQNKRRVVPKNTRKIRRWIPRAASV